MKINVLLISFLVALSACNPFESNLIYNEGINTISETGFPIDSVEVNHALAKVYKGNTFLGSGSFISKQGLFLTNYANVLDHFSSSSTQENITFEKGFNARTIEEEVPLRGIYLLVELEQKDVTAEIQDKILDTSTNYQVFQSIKNQKEQLISARRANNPDLFVEIQDLYSGNAHVMVVYKVIRDVRLVFAPPVGINTTTITNSAKVFDAVTNEYAILRAYQSSEKTLPTFAKENIPYTPSFHFSIPNGPTEKPKSVTAVGFPNQTYRLESERAIRFYHTSLNPYALSGYKTYLQKEDFIANKNNAYAIASIPNRVNISQNIALFDAITNVIIENNLLELKKDEEKKFKEWARKDTARFSKYIDVLSYIDQAFKVAEQTGDILYSTTYFSSFSLLDDLAKPFSDFFATDFSSYSEADKESFKMQAIQKQEQLLSQIDIEAELLLMKGFLPVFGKLPENKQPLTIFDLFDGIDEESRAIVSDTFIEKQKSASFLFDPSKSHEILSSGSQYSDSLFVILDELSFSLSTAQQNYSLHYSYLYPAQRIFVLGKEEQSKKKKLLSDAANILSYNQGSINPKETVQGTPYFYATNDFSGRSAGSALLDENGMLLGIVSDEINTNILGNYYYTKEHSYIKGIRSSFILDELRALGNTDRILSEISR